MHGFLPIVSTAVVHNPWLNPWDTDCDGRRAGIQKLTKLNADFCLEDWAPPAPVLFKGQLYHHTVITWGITNIQSAAARVC